MGTFLKYIFAISAVFRASAPLAYAKETQDLFDQAAHLYDIKGTPAEDLISGFSMTGMLGGILFGGIGFIAFMYGKRMTLLKPMIIGILMMVYPYFIRDTMAVYAVGGFLTAALFILGK